MSTSNIGPFYVVLGGNKPGILHERPADMATGAFATLLPIVVACAHRAHATAVNALNSVLAPSSRRDAHSLAYGVVQQSALAIRNHKSGCPIYAIRKTVDSKETGVWIGFGWHDNQFRLHGCLPREDLGTTVPRARTMDAASPTSESTPLFPRAAAQIPSSSRSRAHASRASTSCDDSFASAEGDRSDMENALASLSFSDSQDAPRARDNALALQILAGIIAPPPGMVPEGENISRFPISFGAESDEFLMKRGINEWELWLLLPAREHAGNIDQFVHQLTHLASWTKVQWNR